MKALESYAWPGNIRELRNVVERAVVLSEGGEILDADLPPELSEGTSEGGGGTFHERAEGFRRSLIAEALEASGGNQTQAAKALGLQRTYLARLIKKYGL